MTSIPCWKNMEMCFGKAYTLLVDEEDPLEEEKRDRDVSILSIDLKEFLQQESHKGLRNLGYT